MEQEIINTSKHQVSLTNVLNSVEDIIYITDSKGSFLNIYGNEVVKTAKANGNYIREIISELFEKDTNRLHSSAHKRALAGEIFSYEWNINYKTKTFFYKTILSPLKNDASETIGVVGIIHNISREKALEKYHREIKLMFKTLTNVAKSAIISVNEFGSIEYCNPATLQLFGYDEGEIRGELFTKLIEGVKIEKSEDGIIKFDENLCDAKSIELLGVRKNGEKIPIEFSISQYKVFNTSHHVLIIQDISSRKKAEEERKLYQKTLEKKNSELQNALEDLKKMQNQLIQSEKMASLGALVAGIAHEINNPLAFVSSNLNRFKEYFYELVGLLNKWREFGGKVKSTNQFTSEIQALENFEMNIDLGFIIYDCKELLQHNTEGIERIKNIVMQLRGFSHISEDHAVEADINKAMDETLTLIWNELKYKAEVIKEYESLPKVRCYIREIQQIFVNLLINSIHAIKEKGEIRIKTFRSGSDVKIQISDNGAGMSPEVKNKIFDPFFTTKPVGEGTGLGLWISMSIIQKHNGQIEVESEEGKGSTFTITLPIESEQE